MGMFLPFDKGLAPISAGTPWAIQQAFVTAFFYHFMMHDKTGIFSQWQLILLLSYMCVSGFVGVGLRDLIGTYDESTIRVLLATLAVVTAISQVLFNAEANLLSPLHKFLYLVFHVNGPNPQGITKTFVAYLNRMFNHIRVWPGIVQIPNKTVGWDYLTRLSLEPVLEVWRVIIVVGVAAGYLYSNVPPSSIVMSRPLSLGGNIGVCHMFNLNQVCSPYTLALENISGKYHLSSYSGHSASGKYVWRLPLASSKPTDSSISLKLSQEGVLVLTGSSAKEMVDRVLWTADKKCLSGSNANKQKMAKLTLDPITGIPNINCPDGSILVF
jgi:hypothetical protein